MGNCQATDAATLVLQHPCGKVERFNWPVTAREVMQMNPGHYVALLISTTFYHSHLNPSNIDKGSHPDRAGNNTNTNPVRLTRIKLLRTTDTLLLGHVYRLITTQEVTKGLYAKKHAKMKQSRESAPEKPYEKAAGQRSEPDKLSKHERLQSKSTTSSNSAARSKTWQPSLHSISEATS